MLIATQALAHDLILVTDNVSEFSRVDGLADSLRGHRDLLGDGRP